MKRFILLAMTVLVLMVPVGSMADSAFHFGFAGSSYGSAMSFGYTSVRHDSVYVNHMPYYGNSGYGHGYNYGHGYGYRCRTPIHYRHVSYRPANWYAHSRGAIVRERYVSHRVSYYGGRW